MECLIGEDVARNEHVNKAVEYFMLSKRAPSSTHFVTRYKAHLERLGLHENLELLCDMDIIFSKNESEKIEAKQLHRK